MLIRLFFHLSLTMVMIAAGPVLAQQAKAQQENNLWVTDCTNRNNIKLRCVVSQTLTHAQTNLKILSASVTKPDKASTLRMTVQVPHGVMLQYGVKLSVDKKNAIVVPIVEANQNGAYANLEVSSSLLDALKRGSALNVTMQNKNGQDVKISLSLKGFTKAIAYLDLE